MLQANKISFKPTLLFFSANALSYPLHEMFHALTAYFLNVNSTLYHFYVNIDHTHTSVYDKIIIAVAGPVLSLAFGLVFWVAYKKSKNSSYKLFMFYAAIAGISFFSGNVFSTAFGGDFHTAATLLQFPFWLQLFATLTGLIFLSVFMYRIGKEVLFFSFINATTFKVVILSFLLIPWILGTLLLALSFLPLPSFLITGMISSSIFWIIPIVSAVLNRRKVKTLEYISPTLNYVDIILVLFSFLIVRALISGVSFAH
ncbi:MULTISPECIES: hypothetical protein [Flavobacterium]|uniref:hypothetical protein n=1 Tax=Flavobacterium TaxID=237 RepID=UPI001FCCA7B3|nr:MULTISPECIES: hypothetical protein [Flavobacterium]UOK42223.1 hypothetical protein LZF87_13000 [Flavobacterium enshiense]